MVELSKLSYQRQLDLEGPSPYFAIIMLSKKSKTNQVGKRFYSSVMRHQNIKLYTMGAIAMYFYQRQHISREFFPLLRRQEEWYNIKVLQGENREQELSYTTQYNDFISLLQETSIFQDMVTHYMRAARAQEAEHLGVPEAQVSK